MAEQEKNEVTEVKVMDRREFIKKTAVGAGALAATLALHGYTLGLAEAATGQKGKGVDLANLPLKYKDYNVILVSFDALQAAHVGSLGYSRNVTPTIDAMAKEGF